ncbi:hypothetical protein C0992_007397 [Termitomyces sp. T32_za158]|nr:hypothetical protein C0992_007397 [Termitomyces sp. T32_za158]
MFDDYVEHSSNPTAPVHAAGVPQLQYEGFELSADELGLQEAYSIGKPDSGTLNTPIFDIGRVQYDFPAPLVTCVVSSDVLVMGFSSNLLVLIELSHADQVIKIRIPRKPTEMTLYKVFMDPSGRHIVITSIQGENWYLYRGWKEPKRLKGLKMVIESIAWNRPALLSASHSTSTREILIGGRNGTIYEAVLDAEEDFFKPYERYLQTVFSLPERHPITGIKFDFFPPADPKRALVIATTASRIYQFVGTPEKRSDDIGRVFSGLFSTYRETVPKILELPGDLQQSELRFYTPHSDQIISLPKTMAWMTGPGIYHGILNFESKSEDFIDAAELLPYPSLVSKTDPEIPRSIALTEFHYVLLYQDRITGICCLDDQVKYEESLPLRAGEQVRGVTSDAVRGTYWIYTDQSLFELVVSNEDRDVWKIYLNKKHFEIALNFAKTAAQRDHVLSAQADAYFSDGRYFQAAQCYAQCSITFEEVSLKFLIPSILQLQQTPRDPLTPNQAIRYLNHLVFEQHNTSPTVHNLLITFHVSPLSFCVSDVASIDDGPLLRFLQTAPCDPVTGKPYYDLDYALRLCKNSGRTQPCVHIYSKMGLWENSVDMALEKGDLDLAKINADMPEEDKALRKKLWLKIARYVVQDKKDIKTAMRFLENTDLLKIEDILPFFPDFVVIDDFKEEIAHALEGYSNHIETLKNEMNEATQTAESIKQDVVALKNRFVTIDAGEQCTVCSHLLLSRQFYVFPCRHSFHADCLVTLVKEYLPAPALRKIINLQNKLTLNNAASNNQPIVPSSQVNPSQARALLSANFGTIPSPLQNGAKAANFLGRGVLSAGDRLRELIVPDALAALITTPAWMPGMSGGQRPVNGVGSSEKMEKLRAELEDVLASSCPLCESVIASLDVPFIKDGEVDTTWAL